MLWHEIVEFMNNELVTRDFGICYEDDFIKTFKDETGCEFLYITIRTNGYDAASYWLLYDRDWWERQSATTIYKFNGMTFQVNNMRLYTNVFVDIELVSVNKIGEFLNSNVAIEYNDCVFSENIGRRLCKNKHAKLNNCHFE